MASGNVCWGIELGAGALKALKLQRNGDNLEVLEFVEIPHKRVLSAPELDVMEANRLAISTLQGQYDLTGATIAISVPGHSAFARFAKLPPVEPKKIKDIVKFEAVQQIPFPLEEVEWDYQTFVNKDSPEVEVGIFAMTREKVMERLSLWAEANVTPDIVTLSPVAAYNAVAHDQAFSDKTPGTVILDVGTTSTDLIVAEPGRMWIRTFPLGGHNFTEALVSAFKLSYLKAEKLKREAEASKHARHVFQAMRPVFSDLAQDVSRSIGYYQNLHKDANLTRLIGLGSTFALPGLRKYLSQQLQMEVVRLEGWNRVKLEGTREAEFTEAASRFATCYGLCLQGLDLQSCTANLMPVPVIREAMWKRKVKWFGLAAGIAVVGAGACFVPYLLNKPVVESAGRSAVLDQTKAELKKLNAEWQKVSGGWKDDFKAANAAALLEHRDVYAYLVDDFGQMLEDARKKASAAAKEGTSQSLGFMFNKYETRFGSSVVESSGAEDMGDSRRRPAGRGAPPAPMPGGEPQTKAKIGILIEVATTQANPDTFIRETIKQWMFEQNKSDSRKMVPYTYEIESISVKKTGITEVKDDKKPEGSPSGAPTPTKPAEEPPPDERGGGRGNRGGRGAPLPSGEGGMMGEGVPQTTPNPTASQMSGVLSQMAPLPKPPLQAEPGSTISTFQISFDAILRDPAAIAAAEKAAAEPNKPANPPAPKEPKP